MNAAEITASTTQSASKALWLEFLLAWFDGTPRAIGTESPMAFPLLTVDDIRFDQSDAVQPLQSGREQEIRIIQMPLRRRIHMTPGADGGLVGRDAYDQMTVTFWMTTRCASMAQSNLRADATAQLLYALLSNPDATRPLATRGIGRMRPLPPRPLVSAGAVVRMLATQAAYIYRIPFEG